MILQEQECAFLFVESGVNEGEAMLEAPHLLPAVRPSWPLIPCVLSTLLTWTRGFCCPLVVIFSMVPLSLEVSYKPSLGSSQTYEQDSQDVVCREGNPGNRSQGTARQKLQESLQTGNLREL